MAQTVQFRAEIDEYTNRVLGVIKEKYGLKDKSVALKKFAEMYGDEFVEKEVNDAFVQRTVSIVNEHHQKYPARKMNMAELDKLTGL